MKRIVIVGGGFAGTKLAKSLSKNQEVEVLLIDKENYSFFPPLIYQVATGFIEYSHISYPLRKMFGNTKNVQFLLGTLQKINPQENTIETENQTISYDYLVLAMGTETNYFGLENIKKNALPLKTINDALAIRNHLLQNLEKASQSESIEEIEKFKTIVIAGGGPTGVEVAGMLAELGKIVITTEYPELKEFKGTIHLVSSTNSLLTSMSVKAQKEAFKQLNLLGVNIKLNLAVKDFIDQKVFLSNGEIINSNTLLWAAGVVAKEAKGLPEESIGAGRRILVNEFNQVHNTKNIFAIGDISLSQKYLKKDENYPQGHPQLAQVAIQQANLLAKNLTNIMKGKSPIIPFKYVNKGSMAIISKNKAVVDLPKGFYKGYFAFLTWLFVHIIPLAGFRNRFNLAFNWFLNYVTNNSALRYILNLKK